ncbi:MAG: hypothetical protein Q8738_01895 [Candidatus Phytoplasma australasiaticum]|nr:hypothetical protein [Candidatus Phytoplasma australasiaticum]
MFYNLKIKYLKNMKKYAIQENIPIIPEETGIFLENFINTKKIVDILEIGTAVGYSALTMCNPTNRIQTLERSKIYYQLAKKIFSHTPFNIEVIWTEALIYQPKKDYDLIFIDDTFPLPTWKTWCWLSWWIIHANVQGANWL